MSELYNVLAPAGTEAVYANDENGVTQSAAFHDGKPKKVCEAIMRAVVAMGGEVVHSASGDARGAASAAPDDNDTGAASDESSAASGSGKSKRK